MAEYGEWTRKGATLSDVTAKKEYGVDQDFIIKGIKTGKLEYREGVMWGNPYLRLLRSQLEPYIAKELGEDRLSRGKNQTELRKIKKEIARLNKRLNELQGRKTALEKQLMKKRGGWVEKGSRYRRCWKTSPSSNTITSWIISLAAGIQTSVAPSDNRALSRRQLCLQETSRV